MNKEKLIKIVLITLIFVLGSLVVIHFTPDYQKNVSFIAYLAQSLMYGLIGVVLGVKSFRNKINWHMKASDIVLIFILGFLILHPFYMDLLPYHLLNFLVIANVQIVSSIVLGYLVGNSMN